MRRMFACSEIVCDGCGVVLGALGEMFNHFPRDPEGTRIMVDTLRINGWLSVFGDLHYCPRDALTRCARCGGLLDEDAISGPLGFAEHIVCPLRDQPELPLEGLMT